MHSESRRALEDSDLQPVLARWLAALQKRGRIPTRTTFESHAEADALRGLVGGRRFESLTVATSTIETRLAANSEFRSIQQLLDVRFGKVVTQPELRKQADAAWNDAWASLQEAACRTAPADLCRRVFRWMEADRRDFQRRCRRQGAWW
jgi:hypothetical protein